MLLAQICVPPPLVKKFLTENWEIVRARVYRGVQRHAGPLTWHGHCTQEFKEAVSVYTDLQQDEIWEKENRLLEKLSKDRKDVEPY